MRTVLLLTSLSLALAACQKSETAKTAAPPAATATVTTTAAAGGGSAEPTRKSGLWEQSMANDGKPMPLGKMRVCTDPTTDAKASLFGQKGAESMCSQHSTSRALDGSYTFASTCNLGSGGVVTSKGTARGDFSTAYHVHLESSVTGASVEAMNGQHVMDMDGKYLGPCPAGVAPGDVVLGNGMKFNGAKLRGAAKALSGGG